VAHVHDLLLSADVETDGPIPGPFSMLSFAFVEIGTSDGLELVRPATPRTFYRELRPIAPSFDPAALAVSGLDRERLAREGADPGRAMDDARAWIEAAAGPAQPVLVAFPLAFDWMWLYWYFMRFGGSSPFRHSRGFDLKTAFAVKARRPLSSAGRDALPAALQAALPHTHHALDDAREQAEIFARLFAWRGADGA
jgi:hypothetical protein